MFILLRYFKNLSLSCENILNMLVPFLHDNKRMICAKGSTNIARNFPSSTVLQHLLVTSINQNHLVD